MRRLAVYLLLVLLAVACGGDSTTAPKGPTFPSVAGVFRLTGSFSSPPGSNPFTGTVTFSQASREQPALTGTANIVVVLSSGTATFTTIDNASISESGLIGFNLGGTGGTTTWRFTGVLNGATVTGSHTLASSTTSFPGTFTATKQ